MNPDSEGWQMPLPSAPGIAYANRGGASVDYSDAANGYVVARLEGHDTRKWKLRLHHG